MSEFPDLLCEECGETAVGFDDDGVAICEDCLLEQNCDLESQLQVALNGSHRPEGK
jgi:hypothetical protein